MLEWHANPFNSDIAAHTPSGSYYIYELRNNVYALSADEQGDYTRMGSFRGERAVEDAKLTVMRWVNNTCVYGVKE